VLVSPPRLSARLVCRTFFNISSRGWLRIDYRWSKKEKRDRRSILSGRLESADAICHYRAALQDPTRIIKLTVFLSPCCYLFNEIPEVPLDRVREFEITRASGLPDHPRRKRIIGTRNFGTPYRPPNLIRGSSMRSILETRKTRIHAGC